MRDQQHLGRKEQSKAGQTPQYYALDTSEVK